MRNDQSCAQGIKLMEPRKDRLFNRAKIVLNLHLSELANTETRLCEAAGAGAFGLGRGRMGKRTGMHDATTSSSRCPR